MTEPLFQIGAQGVDVERIMADIQAAVARKMERGVYRDVHIAQAERTNLANLQDDEAFLRYYLDCLRNAVFIDINDFEIRERRRLGAGILVGFKKTLWKLLKFYTYRLWSQQNQVNGLLVTALEGLDEKYRNRLRDLERRLAALEEEKAKSCRPPNA
jgi:hypothetical protein